MRGLQLADYRLFVTVCHRHLPTADREMNHRLSRQTRHQHPAARAAHGRAIQGLGPELWVRYPHLRACLKTQATSD